MDEDYKVLNPGPDRCGDTESRLQQLRHQAKTVAQLKDFVGKLGGLQTEHQSLRLRKLLYPNHELESNPMRKILACPRCSFLRLEQIYSTSHLRSSRVRTHFYTRFPDYSRAIDLLASYDVNGQIAAVEDLIAQEADMQIVLRLLCLASIVSGGIKAKTLENIKREILQACTLCY